MNQRLLLAAVLAALSTSVHAQDAPAIRPSGIAWENDYEKALARAERENRPLMVAFVLQGEPANEQMMREHFRDREIIAFSRNFVCLVACPGVTEDVEGARTDGTRGPVSKKLGGASTKEIQKIEYKARTRLLEARAVNCPQFLFLAPDGERVLLRHVWMLPKRALLKKMRTAFAAHERAPASANASETAGAIDDLMTRAAGTSPEDRRAAIADLASREDPRIQEFLTARTHAREGQLQRAEVIFFGLGQQGNARHLPHLQRLLRDRDAIVRAHAAIAIGRTGLAEAVPALQKALKSERQDRVRSHLMRAMAACIEDPAVLEKALSRHFRARGEAECLTALHLATTLDPNPKLAKSIARLLRSGRPSVRAAAYVTLGTHGYEHLAKMLSRAVKKEKHDVRIAAAWAWAQIGGPAFESDADPSGDLYDALPDNAWWEGRFELDD